MTREEAIEAITRLSISNFRSGKTYLTQALTMAIEALQPEQRWIPVTERLPDEYIPIHVTIKKDGERVVADSYFNAGSKTFVLDTYSDYAEGEVLAWMPWIKPEPWKGDADG